VVWKARGVDWGCSVVIIICMSAIIGIIIIVIIDIVIDIGRRLVWVFWFVQGMSNILSNANYMTKRLTRFRREIGVINLVVDLFPKMKMEEGV